MAEVENTTTADENNSGPVKVIAIIVGMLILGVVAYLIINPANRSEETDKSTDVEDAMEVEIEGEMIEEANEMQENAMVTEAMEEVTIVKARAEAIRPLLTTNGVKSLDLILIYVDQNPTAVLVQKTEYPEAVQDAIDTVQSEIADALATGIATKMNTKTITLKNGETVDITEGQEYDVSGVLTEYELSEEQQKAMEEEETTEEVSGQEVTPLGTPYVLTLANGGELYFLFNEETSQAITDEGLVGEQVDMTVEVTSVNEQENIVTYQVVSGPTVTATE